MNECLQGRRVVLASQSPRRRELLKLICDEFTVAPADADETVTAELLGGGAENIPAVFAARKALAANAQPADFVIACDTAVLAGDEILGKPADAADAHRMLSMLSGKTHEVVSGVCMRHMGKSLSFSVKTAVEFFPLTDTEIAAYIATGEPFDKAGAYGIQERGALFVRRIQGDYFNVVGLPVGRLNREIMTFFALNPAL
ncbi:MAG: Maf family protein [Oscillospiraceae bacterium]